MIDLHAIPVMIFNWFIGWGLLKSYEPTETFFTFQSFVAGAAFIVSLSPICFGSNKSKLNSFIIVLNSIIALLFLTKANVRTDFFDFVKIVTSAVILLSPLILLIWYLIKNK